MSAKSSNAGKVTDKRQSSGSPEDDWWNRFFVDYRPVFDDISATSTKSQLRTVVSRLKLRKGQLFLDCPCGIGRTAIPLARRGVRVTGVDIMQSYLDEISKKSDRENLNISVCLSDMRRICFRNEFDAAANLGTSFGYFELETDNVEVLAKAFRALKPGGRFLLQLTNRDWLVKNFLASDWSKVGDIRILGRRQFLFATSQIDDTWIFVRDGKESTHRFRVRVYSYHELAALFKHVGFVDIEGFGPEKNEQISQDTRTMYVLGTKPERTTHRRTSADASS